MALSLDDDSIDRLAEQAQKILKAPSKADAIRQALERVVEAKQDNPPAERPLAERLQTIRDRYQAMGTPDPAFDEKAFVDEMWKP
ncbi:type II toxin-antitoxin system VapB family antitoxin [Neorhizobium alkalisoli]|jgi:antitoxin VapB|uniref:Antitoxin VapB n=1 Tax=Neorhizobium alkalisoli TaxID=528178 RepID=A0A561R2E9_9HYPH|nr:type II toxin-antitoxin system VapB family antitoxin [Neorhizobium alkalisoli]TWF56797.1 antitoxin VapB [Neorhizobium alkalisoli]